METSKEVIEKIKKLLKFAEDAKKRDSQAELENAMAKIQAISMEYNIQIDKIDMDEQVKVGRTAITDDLLPKNEGKWIVSLIWGIMGLNFCRGWTIGGGKNGMVIIGESHNVEIVRYIVDQLIPRIRALGREHFKEYDGPEKKNTFLRGFYVGCVSGLLQRLRDEQDKMVVGNEQVGGLILRKTAAVDKWMKTNAPPLVSGRSSRISSVGGWQKGKEVGSKMSIHKGVGGNNSLGQRLLG